MQKAAYLITIVFFVLSCKNTGSNNDNQESPVVQQSMVIPPAIPAEVMINLYENCTYIDFIFSELPFSMSQEDKASIQQTILNIEPTAPTSINPNCQYLVEQIFLIDGEIFMDAKIFFQPECTYYIFYKNGTPVYSASFTEKGVAFYNNIIQQAQQVRNNG